MPTKTPPPPPPGLQEDLWLPERLAKIGIFIEVEQKIYQEYGKAVQAWLPKIRDAVLTKFGTIDPNGVFTAKWAWIDLVEQFIEKAVKWAFAKTYQSIMGERFEFSNRPYVQQYLLNVKNRLVNTPDEVYQKVKKTVSAGIEDGASIPEIAKGIKADLLTAGAPYWKNRAVTVARTETIGAYNGGTFDAFNVLADALADQTYEKLWLATDDTRVRHTHHLTDGQRVPLNSHFAVGADPAAGLPGVPMMFPGDPLGPAEEVINCRCTLLLVKPGETLNYANRGFAAAVLPKPPRVQPATALVASALAVDTSFADALVAAIITDNWGLHTQCGWTFCRNPLHPGPCKGWKHTLKQVAPGALDALEKVRLKKLNDKRMAKIKALKDAGKSVPKSLLKPIVAKEPKPGPNPVTPDTGPVKLNPATEKKLTEVTQKVKKAFEPKPKTGPKDGDGDGMVNDAEKAAKAATPESPPEMSEKANDASNVAFAPSNYTFDERLDAYEGLDDADVAALVKSGDIENVVSDALVLKMNQGLSPAQQAKATKIVTNLTQSLKKIGPAEAKKIDEGLDIPEANPNANAGQGIDVHAGPPAANIDQKVADLDSPNEAAIKHVNDVLATPQKYSVTEQIGAISGLNKKDFESLPLAKQKEIANKLKHFASSEAVDDKQRAAAINTAKDLGAPGILGSTAQIDAVKAAKSQSTMQVLDRLDAYAGLSQDDFEGLSIGQQTSIKHDLKKALTSTTDGAQKQYVKDIAKHIAGNGPPAVWSGSTPKAVKTEDALQNLMDAIPDAAPPTVAPPTYGPKQKAALLVFNPNEKGFTDWNKFVAGTNLTKEDFEGLPPETQKAVLDALEKIGSGKGTDAALSPHIDVPKAAAKFKQLTGNDVPGTGPMTGKDAMDAAPVVVTNPPGNPPPDTYTTWQNKKQSLSVLSPKKNTKAFKLQQSITNGDVNQRLTAYNELKSPEFKKLPPQFQDAIVADLDNIVAGTSAGHFNVAQQMQAIDARKNLTGADPHTPFTANVPTASAGKIITFSTPAAEKAHNIANNGKSHKGEEAFVAYDALTKAEFDSLPAATQKQIVADLNDLASNYWANNLPSTDMQKVKDDLYPKFVGKPYGAPFVVKTVKKFDTPEAEAGYDAHLNIGDGKPLDRYNAYKAMTKDDFESLPATVQKMIAKDLGDMAYAGKYTNTEFKTDFGGDQAKKDEVKNLMQLLIGGTSSYAFKPKTKAQKEYEKLGDSMFTPAAAGASGNVTTTPEVYKKKIAVAKKNAQALKAAPISFTDWDYGLTGPTYGNSEMQTALSDYRGSGFNPMNDGLRDAKGDLSKFHPQHYAAEVKAMDEALDQSELTDHIQTLRGFGTPEKVWGAAIWNDGNTDLTGMEWVEHGYSSTTTNLGTAESFAGVNSSHKGMKLTPGTPEFKSASRKVVVRIFTPKGTKGIKLSGPEYEYEMVLERGVKYRVVADHGVKDGARRLDLEVIGVQK